MVEVPRVESVGGCLVVCRPRWAPGCIFRPRGDMLEAMYSLFETPELQTPSLEMSGGIVRQGSEYRYRLLTAMSSATTMLGGRRW